MKIIIDILKVIVALVVIAFCIRNRKQIAKVTITKSKELVNWLKNEEVK